MSVKSSYQGFCIQTLSLYVTHSSLVTIQNPNMLECFELVISHQDQCLYLSAPIISQCRSNADINHRRINQILSPPFSPPTLRTSIVQDLPVFYFPSFYQIFSFNFTSLKGVLYALAQPQALNCLIFVRLIGIFFLFL